MADSILRLKVESQEYDNKLKQAAQGLTRYADQCRKVGGTLEVVEKETIDYVRAIGQMDTTSRTATGKLAEMKKTFVELSAQYKQMTDAEKASPFGKALSESLDELKPRIMEAKRQLDDINKSISGASSSSGGGLFAGLGDKMSGALQVFAGNMLTKAAGSVASLGSEMYGMVQQGIELAKQGEGIRIAFERLGRGDILEGLREATHGTVTDLELMKAAVKFNDFKLPVEELGTMLAFAQQKAKDTGQSVDYMVDSIVTGLGRKSLMILDNLGLSATEVKEKMKETGDMTKAVGEIIREQMSKAGDYVETAADRAAQANVNLQNKMEELGRKFAPVEEASSQLWISMKIGILDIIGGPLATLLNQLTEAGRLKNMLNSMNGEAGSGNTKVDNQLKKLNVIKKGGGSDYIFNATLNGMVEDYNRQIMALDAQIKNGGKRPGAGSGESQDVRYLQQKMDALKIMRDQLAAGAKELSKPITIETNRGGGVVSGVGGPGGGRTDKVVEDSIDEILAKQWETASREMATMADSLRGEDTGPSDIWKTLTTNANESADSIKTLTDALGALNESEGISREGTGEENNRAQESMSRDLNKFTGYAEKTLGGVEGILGGLSQLGIELPQGLQDVLSGIQGITSIVTGIASLVAMIEALTTVQTTESTIKSIPLIGWALAGGGIVHAANGYVPGNNYSGDQVPALLNSGELVLNKAQQNALANELQDGGMQNMRLQTEVRGRSLIFVLDNELKAQGKGQLATFK